MLNSIDNTLLIRKTWIDLVWDEAIRPSKLPSSEAHAKLTTLDIFCQRFHLFNGSEGDVTLKYSFSIDRRIRDFL
ncbi:MAG: hypothetical protein HC860_11050 [Alkalinema sp. RU_4_3]|nr:hypothetical protein [Alkalinema sp. RU_4_3]